LPVKIPKRTRKVKSVKKSNIKLTQKQLFKKYKDHLTSRKSVKTLLKSILHNETADAVTGTINNIVSTMNRIIIHTYNFLKLYILHYFNENNVVPSIDKHFIMSIMKTVSKKNNNHGKKPNENTQIIMNNLKTFFTEHYEPLMVEKEPLIYTNLDPIMEYESVKILTCLNNHFQEHFEDMVNRFVNLHYPYDRAMRTGTTEQKTRQFRAELRAIKNKIMYSEGKIVEHDPLYSAVIDYYNNENGMLHNVKIDKSLAFMAYNDPLSLLPIAIRMSRYGEILAKMNTLSDCDRRNIKKQNKKHPIKKNNKKRNRIQQVRRDKYKKKYEYIYMNKKKQKKLKRTLNTNTVKVINCFPLRKSVIPKYIDIDTKVIIDNLLEKEKKTGKKNGEGKGKRKIKKKL